ncbi:MAG: hypothetical protein J3R72DRAFT_446192 [Linnemannia gamsii]|nr:MAG: hypothetical protein J3R72DRAFT_446192 [Linnemannia gamsii]
MTRLRTLAPLLRPAHFSTFAPTSTTPVTSLNKSAATQDNEPFSIYIHWPYCSSKCTYCNFNKYVDPNVDNERMERALVTELKSELAYWSLDKVKRPIRSIYFGGGTPSLARPRMFESILDTLSSVCTLSKDTEISMEGNPSSTTSIETLRTLRDIGINRYSLGIQSFQGHILTELGRDHSPATALRSLIDARAVWPGRVSMDLIMGHSGQTLEDWIKELRFTMDIVDDHLSLYHLTVEPGTALHKDVKQGRNSLPDGDLSTDMYEATIQLTREAGFEHYEVSNFARNKAYSMHNSGHWLGIDYLGIGPGAHGRMTHPQTRQKFRTFTVRDPAGWMRECEESGTGRRKTDAIEPEDSKREQLVLGMRTRRGIDFDRFRQLTGQDLLEYLDKDATAWCIDAGLLQLSAVSLSPTERGMAVADELSVRLLP